MAWHLESAASTSRWGMLKAGERGLKRREWRPSRLAISVGKYSGHENAGSIGALNCRVAPAGK